MELAHSHTAQKAWGPSLQVVPLSPSPFSSTRRKILSTTSSGVSSWPCSISISTQQAFFSL